MTGNIVWHLHHIIPKHMGGTDEPENLIRLNVACHAFLISVYGKNIDYYNIKWLVS